MGSKNSHYLIARPTQFLVSAVIDPYLGVVLFSIDLKYDRRSPWGCIEEVGSPGVGRIVEKCRERCLWVEPASYLGAKLIGHPRDEGVLLHRIQL